MPTRSAGRVQVGTYGEIERWDVVSRVTNISRLFESTKDCNPDISAWNTSAVIDMSYAFSSQLGTSTFNQPRQMEHSKGARYALHVLQREQSQATGPGHGRRDQHVGIFCKVPLNLDRDL